VRFRTLAKRAFWARDPSSERQQRAYTSAVVPISVKRSEGSQDRVDSLKLFGQATL
jgi:hypothetical protein